MFVTPPHDDCIGSGFVKYKYNFSSIFPTLTSEVSLDTFLVQSSLA